MPSKSSSSSRPTTFSRPNKPKIPVYRPPPAPTPQPSQPAPAQETIIILKDTILILLPRNEPRFISRPFTF